MAIFSLKDRISSYEEISNYKLLSKLPIIIQINGRSFSKITSLLDKPYCEDFSKCMNSTMLQLCLEIEGAVFGYHFNDEIIIVAKNDQNMDTIPWYDNKIQKITSVTSSVATLHFSNLANAMDLNLMGDPIFLSHVYTVPNTLEAINVIISKQLQNFQTALQLACFYELLKKYNKDTIKDMLSGLTSDEKIDLLLQECDINFNDYPIAFRRGAASYRAPKLINNDIVKNKWIINEELPIFTQDNSFLVNIVKNGADIIRKDSDD
jgi:tRNA(His) 5'-end guanylyltransferase